MNRVCLVGRLTKDPEERYSNDGMAIVRFSLAVNRPFSKKNEADFLNCVFFGKTAESLAKYFSKGMRIGLTGRIQTGSYKKQDGTTVYTTDIIGDSWEFVENKQTDEQPQATPTDSEGFMNVSADDLDDLPFV